MNTLWLKTASIANCLNLSNQGLRDLSKRQNWTKRPSSQGKGGGYEFLLSSLPPKLVRQVERKLLEQEGKAKPVKAVVRREANREAEVIKRQQKIEHFLRFYQTAKAPSVAKAYRAYKAFMEEQGLKPLAYTSIKYHLDNLPPIISEKGRKTGSAFKSLDTYIRRDWAKLDINDCWAGDGHALHAKIKHPITGRAFRPEITLIIDCASRLVVGYSVSLAENSLAIVEALKMGVVNYGVPFCYYSDNGAGQTNHLLDDDLTGIFYKLDVRHYKALPANPQARGIIERLMESLAHNIAERFPTYFHRKADQETIRKTLASVGSASKAQSEGRELTTKQSRALTLLPTYDDLIRVMEEEINLYNNTPHSAFDKQKTPWQVYQEKTQDTQRTFLELAELNNCFAYSSVRKTDRGLIRINKGQYFNEELILYSGEKVICHLPLTSAEKIEVFDMKGRFICVAELDGNLQDAIPMSVLEEQKEQRKKRRIKKLEDDYRRAEREQSNLIEAQYQQNFFEMLDSSALREALPSANEEVFQEPSEAQKEDLLNRLLRPIEP